MTDWPAIIGYEHMVSRFQRFIADDRCPQALLLEGRAGLAKSLLAKYLAATMYCSKPQGACGQCLSCTAIFHNRQQEILLVDTEGQPIKNDHAKLVAEHLAVQPEGINFCGKKLARTVIIADCDLMTKQAANRLLKILEEPPKYAQFIFTTSRYHALPPTLMSRLVSWHVNPPDLEAATIFIKKYCDKECEESYEIDSIKQCLLDNGGSIGKALHELSNFTELKKQRDLIYQILVEKDSFKIIQLADNIVKKEKIPLDRFVKLASMAANYYYKEVTRRAGDSDVDVTHIKRRLERLMMIRKLALKQRIAINAQLAVEAFGLAEI